MKRIFLLSLLLLLLIVAMLSAGSLAESGPAPTAPAAEPEVDLEEMALLYPKEYDDWQGSVHGAAYLAGNSDAPGCTGCHGDPASGEIQTAEFRLTIASRCARCHADAPLMAKYGIAADTYETYRADYHGATVEYYRAQDPTMWRYEATCSDCHTSHAIYSVADDRSSVAPTNLLATCRKCHQGAGAGFATPAIGHLRSNAAGAPLVYALGLAYRILIPVVLGGMLAYIALDIAHRARQRNARRAS